jgi:hypothetical protein
LIHIAEQVRFISLSQVHPFLIVAVFHLPGREHVILAAEHFRPLQAGVDFQPHFPSERVGPELETAASCFSPRALPTRNRSPR